MARSRGKPHRTWSQRLFITCSTLVCLGALAGAAAFGYVNTKLSDVQRLALSSVLTKADPAPGAPQNFLIVGTDSDLGLSSSDPAVQGRGDVTGDRSDTIMILHVDPKKQTASLLSLQRDLWVTIAGEGIKQKINSAIGLGGDGTAGPAKLIETIKENFGIPINHYVEIDFNGFEQVIKTVGGIPIYFNTGLRDRDSATGETHTIIDIPGPGCYTLDPAQALAYARTRHIQIQATPGDDSSWIFDQSADFGRISRQQDFVKRVLKRAVSKGIRDPLVMNDLVNGGLKSVKFDTDLTAGDLLTLGRRFRSFNPDSLQTVQLPAYATTLGGASVVLPIMPEAEVVLNEFRNTESTVDDVHAVDVQVLNGTGRYNEASAVSTLLGKVGFQLEQPGDDLGVTDTASIIRYQPGQEQQAHLLARYLRSGVRYQLVEPTTSAETAAPLVLLTGTSYEGVLATPKAASRVPGPPAATTTTTAPTTTAPGGTGSTSSTSTAPTTSIPGYVPGPAPAGASCG